MNEPVDIIISRKPSTDQGTEGLLSIPGLQFSCPCLELPWKDNQSNISCIPAGTYMAAWRESRKWKAFHLKDVPGRSFILIHAGNFAGDVSKGWKTNVLGCILLGTRRGIIKGQRAVLVSRPMVRRFNNALRGRTLRITIQWETNHD
jgi:hypothetical protein